MVVRSVRFVEMVQPAADDLAASASYAAGRSVVSHLDAVKLPELSAAGRVDALVAWDKVIRWATANRDRVLAAMWAGQQGPAKDKEWAREDVATALRISPNYATDLLRNADELVTRLPGTLALLEDGELTTYQARVIAEAVAPLDDTAAAEVEKTAISKAPDLYAGQFRQAVARAVIAADPAGAAERRHRAHAGRRVTANAQPDGMGSIYAELSIENTQAVYGRIDAKANTYLDQCRSADQKRADALVELITGGTDPDRPAGPNVQVSVALSTLLGLDEQPGELERFGPIAAEVARFLASAESAQWRLLITDARGVLYDYARSTYRPPAQLRRYLEARDKTCRFPGCNRPARLCEADHLERWTDDGHTDETNMHMLSGRHHHAKDDHDWAPTRASDGSTDWRSPTGHHYLVPPATYPVDRALADPDPPPF